MATRCKEEMEVSIIGKSLTPLPHQYSGLPKCTNLIYKRCLPPSTNQIGLYPGRRTEYLLHGNSDMNSDLISDSDRYRHELGQSNMISNTYQLSKLLIENDSTQRILEDLDRNIVTPRIRSSCMIRSSDLLRSNSLDFHEENSRDLEKLTENLPRDRVTPNQDIFTQKESTRHKRRSSRSRRKSRGASLHSATQPDSKYGREIRSNRNKKYVLQQPTELILRNKTMLPSRTKPSLKLPKSTWNQKQYHKGDGLILPKTSSSPERHSIKYSSEGRAPKTKEFSTQKVAASDDLLQSLDSALSARGKRQEQLTTRIQLIHKYGNEDVIAKHSELKRKREVAYKHKKKLEEIQTKEKLKQIQRSKIYALNHLMTRLEQEQFEEYLQQNN